MSNSNPKPILSVENLTTSFVRDGRLSPVVRNISFDVAPGDTVAIVGESGSGKSVTALSVMRLVTAPNSRIEGSVRLDGRELLTLPEQAMRHIRGTEIAMIFQEPMTSLNPVLTIGYQISEALVLQRGMSRSEARAETIRLLEKVRIPGARARFDVYPHSLSGGMRQRVMIAMALSCRPKLLIADEPTTALDVTIQAQILDLIKELQEEEQMSVLFITHDMGVVAEIADRAIVMYQGEVVEMGATQDIFGSPQKPYTKALLSAVPRLGSMKGHLQPIRFPTVDKTTGEAEQPGEAPNTVRADDTVLDVRNLTTRFKIRSGFLGNVSGRVHAVEDVSFSIQAGETLSLVGESGSGKSTIGRSVLRLIEPQSGEVFVNGQDVLKLHGQDLRVARRDMQIVFQDPFASLNPRLPVGEAIVEPILTHGLASRSRAWEMTEELLRRVGLTMEMAARYPHEFSGGQRQRVCIARALALRPKLIVADEAVSALDVSIKAQVINLMLELQESLGVSYLFISHDMAAVERVSHRVAVLYLGEIVEIGPRQAIFDNPQHPYTKRLISAVPIPDPAYRGRRRFTSNDEIKSAIRPLDYLPPVRRYIEVEPGHLVQEWGSDWEAELKGAA
ncbi:MAG: ABC transporter ATP-binding protein [Nitratireductor sp.]|nr:ABC transporter ATP-binding protein [Nitratireductor sp.]